MVLMFDPRAPVGGGRFQENATPKAEAAGTTQEAPGDAVFNQRRQRLPVVHVRGDGVLDYQRDHAVGRLRL
jgi:hypothetical protein